MTVYEQMPSIGRKFLMAGKSGLNITHTEDQSTFLSRFHDARIADIVRRFGGAAAVRAWMTGLGIEEHVGSSGRVFPKVMKASPLLRAWLERLSDQGVELQTRHRLARWDGGSRLELDTPDGRRVVEADRIIFAAGGGSWRRLGSDGAWTDLFRRAGVATNDFWPANVGLLVPWSEHMTERFEGAPLKNVALRAANGTTTRGECVVTARGLESGAVYPLSHQYAEASSESLMVLTVDLLPGRDEADIVRRLARQNPKQSLSNRLRKGVRIEGVKAALLREGIATDDIRTNEAVARRIKALPLKITGTAPLDEAISTRGGVPWDVLTDDLTLKNAPGVACAGEMIDWDAPTGGYLLTACLATGWLAGITQSEPGRGPER